MAIPARTRRGLGRTGRRVALALLAALGLILAALATYTTVLFNTASQSLGHADLLPATRTPAASEQSTEGATRHPEPPRSLEGPQDILLIGEDKEQWGTSRADVIILAHVNADRTRVDLIHVPRDYYVQVADQGRMRINEAYSRGGAPLLASTVQDLFGVQIDHVAVTTFDGFQSAVDALGGVDVLVKESNPARDGFPAYTAGEVVHLDGEQALAFARERKSLSAGDISRGNRQMDLLEALGRQMLTPEAVSNPAAMVSAVSSLAGNVTTDQGLGVSEMAALGWELRDAEVSKMGAPVAGNAVTDGGAQVIVPDVAALEELGEALDSYAMGDAR